ncbi:CvpA family protein [Tumebacillus permanentifrigoris]|uniref:Putative membrane protein required for colicin V production n=1 Tax=Tumebacillus permanentifrigoris TaxID=378543 RepID=A0A316DWN0_9BACL|nr:CvpA family protein [Tumebacillus permanentifrigoris]PWK13974.1 putative membrane protein required for colicin V production [Tumebacillus permanentifrigoris]
MTDVVIGVFLLLAALNGWRTGLIRQIISLIGGLVAYFVAKSAYPSFVPVVAKYVTVTTATDGGNPVAMLIADTVLKNLHGAIAFLLLFFVSFFVVKFIGRLLDMIANLPGLSIVNRIAGAGIGLTLAVFIVALVVNVMNLMPQESIRGLLQHSQFAALLISKFKGFLPVA